MFALLSGHSDVVNAVKYYTKGKDYASVILSGSADKSVRIWLADPISPTGFTCAAAIAKHDSAINCIATSPKANLFVTGSVNHKIRLWGIHLSLGGHNLDVLNEITHITTSFIPLAIETIQLSNEALLLAISGTRSNIQLYLYEHGDCRAVATLHGHEGWIKSLSAIPCRPLGEQNWLLASASQDKYVRLWRIKKDAGPSDQLNESKENKAQDILSNTLHQFECNNKIFSVTFEALLASHEDWIFSAKWSSQLDNPRLLTSSADNSLAIWQADPSSGIWVCIARLGEASALKGATSATGSTGGLWNGLWSPDGNFVACLCRTGGWRMWEYNSHENLWCSVAAISGHTKSIRALVWAPDGSYLLSTSADQTTRLFSKWIRGSKYSWHECARPQIHGYDLNCVACVTNTQFVSGADEKLLRVFDMPFLSARILNALCGLDISENSIPASATIPVLGLSNKITGAINKIETEGQDISNQKPTVEDPILKTEQVPHEDKLSRYLLWPESEKLYGHGHEISAVAGSHDNMLVATACRATSTEHAAIRIYATTDWREIKPPLVAHNLTVTKIAFSMDDKFMLSVGRDRQWALFVRSTEEALVYKLFKVNPKGHARMLLDASWSPSISSVFATAGRDKLVKIWQVEENDTSCMATIPFSSPVTSVAFLPREYEEQLVLAVGTEGGLISIERLNMSSLSSVNKYVLDNRLTPSKAVTTLVWNPKIDVTDSNCAILAASSEDASLVLYKVFL